MDFERQIGVVSEIYGDEVEVTYETAEGQFKQIYLRNQFMDRILPKEGDEVESVESRVMILIKEDNNRKTKETEFVSDLLSFRDKVVTGSIRL